jgi:hypothetical protein
MKNKWKNHHKESFFLGQCNFGMIDRDYTRECNVDCASQITPNVKGQVHSLLKGICEIIVPYCTI